MEYVSVLHLTVDLWLAIRGRGRFEPHGDIGPSIVGIETLGTGRKSNFARIVVALTYAVIADRPFSVGAQRLSFGIIIPFVSRGALAQF